MTTTLPLRYLLVGFSPMTVSENLKSDNFLSVSSALRLNDNTASKVMVKVVINFILFLVVS